MSLYAVQIFWYLWKSVNRTKNRVFEKIWVTSVMGACQADSLSARHQQHKAQSETQRIHHAHARHNRQTRLWYLKPR